MYNRSLKVSPEDIFQTRNKIQVSSDADVTPPFFYVASNGDEMHEYALVTIKLCIHWRDTFTILD
jgi:hypothetical protein